MSRCPEHSSVRWASSGPRDPGCLHLGWEQLQEWTADRREKAGHWTGRLSTQMLGAAPQLVPGHRGHRGPGTHVMPISFRSLSVRVRKMRRSTSCSSNTCRYLRQPICSSSVARS